MLRTLYVLVEGLQNIYNHQQGIGKQRHERHFHRGDHFEIVNHQPINTDSFTLLNTRLSEMKEYLPSALKLFFRNHRQAAENIPHSAGLGLEDILRRTRQAMHEAFRKLSGNLHFYLKVVVHPYN